jgi:GT2 family glycosyltransferase
MEGGLVPEHAVIGYVTGGLNRNEFTTSLLAITRKSRTVIDDVIAFVSGPNISRGRNMVVAGFLEDHDAPWLFMCDTDMRLPPDAVDRLVQAADPQDRPVVGGLCFTEVPGGQPLPTLYELVQDGDGQPAFARHQSWPDDGLVRVTATGAACLLIHRDALEHVGKSSGCPAAPWFRESVLGASLIGEDLTFCLRCGAAGIPVHVATGVKAGHMKTTMLI